MTPSGTGASSGRGPSQNDRVLAALRRGPVNPVDFAQAPTIDGGKTFLRLAARIGVLKDRGHKIASAKQANGTVTYSLIREADAARSGHSTTTEAPHSPRSAVEPVSQGAPSRPHGSGAACAPTPASEPTLFDWPKVAA